jgi:hypothetical protein
MPSAVHHARWASAKHVGPAKPSQVVKIQRGHLARTFQHFELLDGSTENFGVIWQGQHNGDPWHPVWHAFEDWITVPNVKEVTITKSLGDEGIVSAEVHIENVAQIALAGPGGAYHKTERGHYAPFRGALAPGRNTVATNEWFDVLNGGHRIKIWQGYGDALEPVFCGLVDDTDVSVAPDTITLTSRMGGVLVDEFIFGWAKAADIRSPITFAPRTGPKSPILDFEKQGSAASASSADDGYPAHNVTTTSNGYWRSQLHSTPSVTEWVQIRLPAGTYEDFYLDPHYDGMEVYVSVYARGSVKVDPVTGGTVIVPARKDGVDIEDGWVSTGAGTVPGTYGGHPYIRVAHDVTQAMRRKIGARLTLGNDSVLRLSFRKLQPSADSNVISPSTPTGYRAGARRVLAYREVLKKKANAKGWILIDDASDMVKWALMWAGFHEWQIESFGTNILEPVTFSQSDRLIDIIRSALAQGNYNFFIAAPTAHDLSMGVPTFRNSRALAKSSPSQIEVRHSNLLTRLETKYTTEGLHYVIRHRGRQTKTGHQLAEDKTKRVQATYFPPWSGAHHNVISGAFDFSYPYPGSGAGRLTGVMKHFTNTNDLLTTEDQCQFANLLVAIIEALNSYTATLEIPGYPLELDEHISVIDPAGGVHNRVWTASVQTTFVAGQDTSFVTSIGGSLIDSPDLLAIALDYILMAAKIRAQP